MKSGISGFRFLLLGLLIAFSFLGLQKACGPEGQFLISSVSAAPPVVFHSVHEPLPQTKPNRLAGSCLFMDEVVLLDILLPKPDKVKMMIHRVGGQMLYMRHWAVAGNHLREEVKIPSLEAGVYVLHVQSSTQEMKQVLVL